MQSDELYGRRFWTLYVAAWIPYALSYYVLFRSTTRDPVYQTAYNILPAMLIGILVLHWCGVVGWHLHLRRWFYLAQLGSALLYSLLWATGVLLTGSLGHALRTGHFSIGMFTGYALQWQFFSGLMIYGNIAGASYVLQASASLHREERRRERAEALQTVAELSALRAQLNPHFLFNTLNSIAALAGAGQPRTLRAISELAAMLRYSLGHASTDENVSLREELEFTDQYLALEQLRLGERLSIVREFDPDALRCRLPPLTLQPLVENAIRHGLAPRANGGKLTIRAHVRHGTLNLQVQDDGLGADSASLRTATGLGLATVRQRIVTASSAALFIVETRPGEGFCVDLTVPQDWTPGSEVSDVDLQTQGVVR